MIGVSQASLWSSGFVVAGLVGVGLLFASGAVLGTKARAMKLVLEGMIAKSGPDHPAARNAPPPVVAILPIVNTGIVLSVVFDMVTKPTSVPTALSVLLIGIALSATAALRRPTAVAVELPTA